MASRALASAALSRTDRALVAGALFALAVLCWADLVAMARDMDAPGMLLAHWTPGYFAAMFAMWVVMMVAMMVPSALPAVLLFAALRRHAGRGHRAATASFAAGYLLAWAAFSLLATSVQYLLSERALLTLEMESASPALAGALLVVAGLYQFTPWKAACLAHCRTPAQFLVLHRHGGPLGPLLTGAHHGLYCVGCCWALMALLFAFGVMNLLWIAALSAFVLVEKLLPAGPRARAWLGAAMVASGVLMLNA